MITGQGNGQGAREQGQKCDQLPGARDIENPEHREYIAGVWGVPEESIPAQGPVGRAAARGDPRRQDQGAALHLLQSRRSRCPTATSSARRSRSSSSSRSIDFFLSETARYADVVLARLADGRRRRHDDQRRGARDPPSQGRRVRPASAREDWRIICDLADRLGAGDKFAYSSPRDIFEELRVASKGGVSDYYGITWERIDESNGRLLAVSRRSTIRARRASTKAASSDIPTARRTFSRSTGGPRPKSRTTSIPIILTTGRVVSHYLSGTQTRRIGALVDQYPQPLCEMHPRLADNARHRGRRLRPGREPARERRRARAGREDHPPGHGLRSLSLAA